MAGAAVGGAAADDLEGYRARWRAADLTAAAPRRVVLVGTLDGGSTGPLAAVLRGLRGAGHAVVHVDPASDLSRRGDPEEDRRRLEPLLRRWAPDLVLHAEDLTGLLGHGVSRDVLAAATPPGSPAGRVLVVVPDDTPAPTRAALRTLAAGAPDLVALRPTARGLGLLALLDAADALVDLRGATGGAEQADARQLHLTARARGCPVVLPTEPDPDALAERVGELLTAGRRDEQERLDLARSTEPLLHELLTGPWLDDRIAAQRRQQPAADGVPGADGAPAAEPPARGPARTVAVSGWYGAANTGDDLILEAVARALSARVPDVTVEALAHDPRRVLAGQGLPAVGRTDTPAVAALAARATAVVLGGGGLWHDYTFARNGGLAGLVAGSHGSPTQQAALPVLARVHDTPVHVHGVGVGPLTDPDAQQVVRWTAGLADTVTVRDEPSRAALLAVPGWDRDVAVAPDCVYGLDPGDLPPPRPEMAGPVVAVSVRPWPAAGTALDALAAVLEEAAARLGARVVGVPMDAADREPLHQLLERLTAPTAVLGRTTDAGQLLADLAACRLLVGMRLHACLLGHRAGTPVVGLGYDPKVRHHFDQLGRADRVAGLDDPAGLAAAVDRCLAEDGRLPAAVTDRVRHLEADAARSLADLADRVAAVPVRPPRPLAVPWEGEPRRADLDPGPADPGPGQAGRGLRDRIRRRSTR